MKCQRKTTTRPSVSNAISTAPLSSTCTPLVNRDKYTFSVSLSSEGPLLRRVEDDEKRLLTEKCTKTKGKRLGPLLDQTTLVKSSPRTFPKTIDRQMMELTNRGRRIIGRHLCQLYMIRRIYNDQL